MLFVSREIGGLGGHIRNDLWQPEPSDLGRGILHASVGFSASLLHFVDGFLDDDLRYDDLESSQGSVGTEDAEMRTP
jgi:hypothetical protein